MIKRCGRRAAENANQKRRGSLLVTAPDDCVIQCHAHLGASFIDVGNRSETHRTRDTDDSFAADPPNAVLAWGEPGTDAPEEAVVVISDPSITADGLQYHVHTLQGTPPATAGPCVLFIDPLGRPLSPVSVAGVRRRDMRRDRRRL